MGPFPYPLHYEVNFLARRYAVQDSITVDQAFHKLFEHGNHFSDLEPTDEGESESPK